MADLLTDEDMGLAPAKGDPPRVLTDSDMGIALPPQPYQPPPTDRPKTLQERGKEVYGFQDLPVRGTILPFGKTDENGPVNTFATPQFMKDMLETALLPGHVMQGGSYTPEDTTRFALDWLVPATSKTLSSGKMTASRLTDTAPSTQALKDSALAYKQLATSTGVVVRPGAQNRLVADVVGVADNALATPGVHDKTIAVVKGLKKFLNGSPSVEGIVRQRQMLQAAREGAQGQDRAIIQQMIKTYDDFINNLTPADLIAGGSADDVGKNLAQFRSLWTKASKSEAIEEIIDNANVAASGFENGLRMGFRSLYKNKDRLRQFSKAEQKLIEEIAMGEGANLYKLIGKFGYGLRGNNMLGGTIGTAGGAAAGGPAGAMLAPIIGGWAAKKAEKATLENAMLARAMAATGQSPAQNPMIIKMLESKLMQKSAGPIVGTAIEGRDGQKPGTFGDPRSGRPVTLPNGSVVYLDPNTL